jgi:hypothetical protein
MPFWDWAVALPLLVALDLVSDPLDIRGRFPHRPKTTSLRENRTLLAPGREQQVSAHRELEESRRG